jgi:RNase adaptor protein for sRNA GlmZ degradation
MKIIIPTGASGSGKTTICRIDCNDEVRRRRLFKDRAQPELADAKMMDWAKYLREEAKASGTTVLDTSITSIRKCAAYVKAQFTKSPI